MADVIESDGLVRFAETPCLGTTRKTCIKPRRGGCFDAQPLEEVRPDGERQRDQCSRD